MRMRFVSLIAVALVAIGCSDGPAAPSRDTPTVTSSTQTGQTNQQATTGNPPATTPPAESTTPPSTPPPTGDPAPPIPPPTPPGPPSSDGAPKDRCWGLVPPTPVNGMFQWGGPFSHHEVTSARFYTVNNAPYDCPVVVDFYTMPVEYPKAGWENQKLLHRVHGRLAPGTQMPVNYTPPCGLLIQVDTYGGSTPENMGPHDSAILLKTPACGPPPTPTPKVEWHPLAVCIVEPNEVEIRGHNLNSFEIRITGQLYARPDGGTAKLISEIPPQYQVVPANGWGGPEERIQNHYSSFKGVVYGWAEAHTMDGKLISRHDMPETRLSCETPAPKVEWHPLAVCDVPPDEVEIRGHNLGLTEVRITGQLFARPDGGTAKLISEIPPAYQVVPADGWGGPEERIRNHWPYFKGKVYGWAEAHTMDGKLISRHDMPETPLLCGTPPPPPPCSVMNPPGIWPTGTVVQSNNTATGARVVVSGTYRNIQNQYVGILWRNGTSKYVKDFKPLNAPCEDGTKSFQTMDWTSTDVSHLPSNGGKYSVIRFTNGDRDNPDIIAGSEIAIP